MNISNNLKRFLLACLTIVLAILICQGGIAAGLFYGWVLDPVQWVDLPPDLLAKPFQEDYLRMAIDSFDVNENCPAALERYHSLGENRQEILNAIIEHPGGQDPNSISAFSKCVID